MIDPRNITLLIKVWTYWDIIKGSERGSPKNLLVSELLTEFSAVTFHLIETHAIVDEKSYIYVFHFLLVQFLGEHLKHRREAVALLQIFTF